MMSQGKASRTILVTSGVGEGRTRLSAFDAALWDAGIANFNLMKLTSIIPPGSVVEIGNPQANERGFGNRLYVVLAEKRETESGREAWAGLGWVQAEDCKGMFVEHEGGQEAEVIRLIEESLRDMTRYREDEFGDIHHVVVGKRCKDKAVCAVVAAVYLEERWPTD